jgi:hypothetical protein
MRLGGKKLFHLDRNVAHRMVFVAIRGGGRGDLGKDRSPVNHTFLTDSGSVLQQY